MGKSKTCTKCLIEQPLEGFRYRTRPNQNPYYESRCRDCENEDRKGYNDYRIWDAVEQRHLPTRENPEHPYYKNWADWEIELEIEALRYNRLMAEYAGVQL